MNQGKTVFAQIMSLIPRYEFDKCVKRYNGNRHAIGFKCRDQFMVMSFAQFTDLPRPYQYHFIVDEILSL
ncbi:MAG: DUF4372 domain-containing protein [Tannerellaceae bacterium]|jgi:hypothetical protein|nr:DUF4372 domain-containing protein [Tannerellaceae bacterium]